MGHQGLGSLGFLARGSPAGLARSAADTLLPQLAGCTVLADAPILLSGVIANPAIPAVVPLPITATTPMGAWAWCQALAIQVGSNSVAMSDGLALSVGY